MPINKSGRFSYVRTYSAWEVNQAWRARHAAMAQSYLADATAIRSALAVASINQIDGVASFAAKAAVSRIEKEAAAKKNSLSLLA
ncbi:MAG: hypothetical protein WCE79_03680 [Xanthobacteraceae bacterium]